MATTAVFPAMPYTYICSATEILGIHLHDSDAVAFYPICFDTGNGPPMLHHGSTPVIATVLDMEIAFHNRNVTPEQVYAGLPEAWLHLMADTRGLVLPAMATPDQIRQALVDTIRKSIVYDYWTTPELRTAVVGRGIQEVYTENDRARLISSLENRDANPNGDGNSPFRFEKLASGSVGHCEVYKYLVTSSFTLVAPRSPAIARVNRQIRNEVMPIFFNANEFELRGILSWESTGPDTGRLAKSYSIDLRTSRIFDIYPEHFTRHIRKLLLSIHYSLMDSDPSTELDARNSVTIRARAYGHGRNKTWSTSIAPLSDWAREDPIFGLPAHIWPTPTRAMGFCGIAGPNSVVKEEKEPQWEEDPDGSIWLVYDVKWRALKQLAKWYLNGEPNDYQPVEVDDDEEEEEVEDEEEDEAAAAAGPDFRYCFDRVLCEAFHIQMREGGRYQY
ncbi:hypothetical protein MBLNU457_3864t1 [Dothideomycetes sp. NU457]